jgi:dienelactone hydrolase
LESKKNRLKMAKYLLNFLIKLMHDFSTFQFPADGSTSRLVYRKGEGPAILIMHELPGMIPECVDLARCIADAGFTVYLPLLFGKPDKPLSNSKLLAYAVQLCVSQEFYCFAKHRSSPITDWLRALSRQAHLKCGGKGVGVIGMCLTGGFVLSLMADESVIAPVMSQPALPFGITASHKSALGVSVEDLELAKNRSAKGVPLLALRFSEDKISPPEKFQTLRQEFGDALEIVEDSPELCWKRGTALETIEINSKNHNPFDIPKNSHAALTLGYRGTDHPSNRVFLRVIEFLQEQCK